MIQFLLHAEPGYRIFDDVPPSPLPWGWTLNNMTKLSPKDIIHILKVCLNCNYLLNNSQYSHQKQWPSWTQQSQPLHSTCNWGLWNKSLTSALHQITSPELWYLYVSDSHTSIKKVYVEEFTKHLTSIQFTLPAKNNRDLPFLVYTYWSIGSPHTYQSLNFQYSHPLQHKLGTVRLLSHRAKSVITAVED